MTTPVRLQLSRRKGFNLQAHSRAINGLPAVSVARPGLWGNPWTAQQYWEAGYTGGIEAANGHCVNAFRAWLAGEGASHWAHSPALQMPPPALEPLRGKNLACWCRLCPAHKATGLPAGETCRDCAPCHTGVIFDLIRQNIDEVTK